MTQTFHERVVRGMVLPLFLLSGVAALIYQTAWQRLLVLFAGGDVAAVTIIVTAFMAGLGVGSLLGGWLADRLGARGSAVLFALAELLTGVLGLLSAWWFHEVLYAHVEWLAASRVRMMLVLFGSLLPPTLLMGLSLPLLARVLTVHAPEAASRVGLLYAVNTLGAACGAGLCVWVLLPLCGIAGALKWAGACNGVCALLLLPLLKWKPTREIPPQVASTALIPRVGLARCALVFMLTGFAALAAEMVWLRVLGAMAKASAHTLGTLLGLYLLGLALGSAAGVFWARRCADAWRGFLRLQGLAVLYTACGTALALEVLQHTDLAAYLAQYEPVDAEMAMKLRSADAAGTLNAPERALLPVYPWMHFMLPLLVMLPATFLMGAGFPLLQKAAQTDSARIGWRTGVLQGANILGCMAGAAGVCVFLLPAGGSALVFRVLAVIGAGLLAAGGGVWLRVTAVMVAAGLITMLPDTRRLWARVHGSAPEAVMVAEDASGVALMKKDAQSGQTMVFINGIGQSWVPYGGVHSLLGALPVLLHPNPERVALIGLGSGDTLHAMLARAETREAWSAEIVSAMPQVLREAAQRPETAVVKKVLEDVRVRFFSGDGRQMLLRDAVGFDVIEADALRPGSAHSGTLYSEEYFRLLAAKLRPGGLAVTWLPTQRVAETMAGVFPHFTVWGGLIGIGSQEPLRVDAAVLQARIDDPAVRAHFQKAGIDLHALLQPVLGPQAQIIAVGPEMDRQGLPPPNTDLFPRDEFMLPSLWEESSAATSK